MVAVARTVPADDGVALHVECDPADAAAADAGTPTVVFTHGFTGAVSTWSRQRETLRGRAPVVLWDQRGHGRSGGGPREHATIDQTGRDLGAVLDAAVPTGRVVLVGHSMGGMSILALAGQRPELFEDRVAGVLLLATPAGTMQWDQGPGVLITYVQRSGLMPALFAMLGLAAPLLDTVPWRRGVVGRWLCRHLFGDETDEEIRLAVRQQFEQLQVTTATGLWRTLLTPQRPPEWNALRRVPVAVVGGHDDRITPIRHSHRIREELGGDTELVVVPHAGHAVVQTHRDDVDDALLRLLDRSSAGAPRATTAGIGAVG